MRGLQSLFLIPFALTAVFFDFKEERIPNWLILVGLFFGFFMQVWQMGVIGAILFLGGVGLPIVLSAPLYYFRMVGGGDIKLLAAAGGCLGPQKIFWCVFLSLLTGSILSLALLLKRRNLKARLCYFCEYLQKQQRGIWEPYLNDKDQGGRIHFAVAILGGILLYAGGVYG